MSAVAARNTLTTPRQSPLASSIARELWELIEAAYRNDGTMMYAAAVSLDTMLREVEKMDEEYSEFSDRLELTQADLADAQSSWQSWRDAAAEVGAVLEITNYADLDDGEAWCEDAIEAIHNLRVDALGQSASLDVSRIPDCPTTGMSARDADAWLATASRDDAQAAYDKDERGVVRGAAKARMWQLDYGERPGWALVSLPGRGSGRGTAKGEIGLCDDASVLHDAREIEYDTRNRKSVLEAIEARMGDL